MSTKVHLVGDGGRIQPLTHDQQRMIDHVAEVSAAGVPALGAMCSYLGWTLERGRRVLAELEELGLAKVIMSIETSVRRLNRQCTRCLARLGKPLAPQASWVATGESGMQWFECGEHDPSDNEAGERRILLEPIADWFSRHGLDDGARS